MAISWESARRPETQTTQVAFRLWGLPFAALERRHQKCRRALKLNDTACSGIFKRAFPGYLKGRYLKMTNDGGPSWLSAGFMVHFQDKRLHTWAGETGIPQDCV